MKSKILKIVVLALVLSSFLVNSTVFAINKETGMSLDNSDIEISLDDAKIIALSFVSNNINEYSDDNKRYVNGAKYTDCTNWNIETQISDIVYLYDENDDILAYSIEFSNNNESNGYIVVSARLDVQLIQEYSDVGEPLYKNFDINQIDKILYEGNLCYYKQDESNKIIDLHGVEIDKSKIKSKIIIKDNNLKQDQLKTINMLKENIDPTESGPMRGPITDPGTYLGSGWEAVEWHNSLENFAQSYIMSGINDCSPTAITNMLMTSRSYRSYYNISPNTITNNYTTVYNFVVATGNFYSFYDSSIGTSPGTENKWIKYVYDGYGINRSIPSITTVNITNIYDKIKNCINGGNMMSLSVNSHEYYWNHTVMGYAYTRWQNKSTKFFDSFVKVSDGLSTTKRYIRMGTITGYFVSWAP